MSQQKRLSKNNRKDMLKKLLGFDSTTMTLRTESIAGITTFLTMSYILAVNTSILSSTGMDKGAVFTATALATALSTCCLPSWQSCPWHRHPAWGSMPSSPSHWYRVWVTRGKWLWLPCLWRGLSSFSSLSSTCARLC